MRMNPDEPFEVTVKSIREKLTEKAEEDTWRVKPRDDNSRETEHFFWRGCVLNIFKKPT